MSNELHLSIERAPVLLFVYKRLNTLLQTILSLQKNVLAGDTVLFIFSDCAKTEAEKPAVAEVRRYIRTITGFKQIHIIEAPKNKGLADSIISGVTQVINAYGRVIVLEDDLLLSPNCLAFMNAALDKYKENSNVFSISAFIFDMPLDPRDRNEDFFFIPRHCSWGWAMWKDRWQEIDWTVSDYDLFRRSPNQKRAFNRLGSDLSTNLIKQMNGKINSWAIRCNYHQFKKQTHTVYPLNSKVINIGFDSNATHTHHRFNKYKATLDEGKKIDFELPDEPVENKRIRKIFLRKYSLSTRLYFYILNKIFK